MNKKLLIALCGVFVVFLTLGIVLNSQQGLRYQMDAFWALGPNGRYQHGYDRIQPLGGGVYELYLNGESITATQTNLPDGSIRMDYSDGWAVQGSVEDDWSYEFGPYAWSSKATLILTDMQAANLRFAPADREERSPIYNMYGNKIVGEFVEVLSAEGDVLSMSEILYEQPELSSPAPSVFVLENGVELPFNAGYSNYIMQNAQGEYLLDAFSLGRLYLNGSSADRCDFTYFLLQIGEGVHEARGSVEAILFYVLLYGLGSAYLLWPEKMAFLGTRWKYRDEPQLSDEGLAALYIGNAVVMLIGIIMLFMHL